MKEGPLRRAAVYGASMTRAELRRPHRRVAARRRHGGRQEGRLCTALERSGFLHTAAIRVVNKYGRSPWGLFWALGIFSGCLTVLIPDDIVTMTLTPITIRMCQLLNLPEIPFLFSQFFAGNIWAVTLVTGNPTNVLLAEDLGDTFTSFAARMGVPGIAAGLTSFYLILAIRFSFLACFFRPHF